MHDVTSSFGPDPGPGGSGDPLHCRRTHRGFALWLAQLALGLLLFAPTISRTLASLSPDLDLGTWCVGHTLTPHHATPGDPAPSHTDDACGYCTLMCHSPALTADIVLHVPLLPVEPLAMTSRQPAFHQHAPLDRRSRGPPVV